MGRSRTRFSGRVPAVERECNRQSYSVVPETQKSVVRARRSAFVSQNSDDQSAIGLRRLAAVAGVVLVLGASIVAYVRVQTSGDSADRAAPSEFPALTSRETFGDDGAAREPDSDFTDSLSTEGEYPETAEEMILLVHGFNTTDSEARDQGYTAQVGVESAAQTTESETTLPLPVVVFSWDSDRSWSVAKEVADSNGALLAEWLADRPNQQQIHLVGHSLGTRVICESLHELASNAESPNQGAENNGSQESVIASVTLLGGAIPADSATREGQYGSAIETMAPTFANFYSRNDRVLSWLYRVSDRTRAVGSRGIKHSGQIPDSPDGEYLDIDVTESVADHHSYFKSGDGCLSIVAEAVFSAE